MPVGRVYQPPPHKIMSPFLESDPKRQVRRNFVLPAKKRGNDAQDDVVLNGVKITPDKTDEEVRFNHRNTNGYASEKIEDEVITAVNGNGECNSSSRTDQEHVSGKFSNGENVADCNGNIQDDTDDAAEDYSTVISGAEEAVGLLQQEGEEEEEETVEDIPEAPTVIAVEVREHSTKAAAAATVTPHVGYTNGSSAAAAEDEEEEYEEEAVEEVPRVVESARRRFQATTIANDNDDDDGKIDRYGQLRHSNEASSSVTLPDRAKGLKNLGNTCFMNSIIQCLAHTRQILEFCQGSNCCHEGGNVLLPTTTTTQLTFPAENESGKKANITRSLAKLVKDMWDSGGGGGGYSSYGSIDKVGDPSAFKREMGGFANKFLGFDQHDSQEFLQYALEGMHSELNRAPPLAKAKRSREINNNNNEGKVDDPPPPPKDPNDPNDPEAVGITPSESGRRYWRQYLKRDSSLVTDLFLGQFRSTLKCTVCDNESICFEPFWLVSLPIPAQGSGSRSRGGGGEDQVKLQDCLDLFVKEETLDGDEKPTCERCKTRTRCTKWYAFERWPKILVVHLKRFAPGERFRSKLSCHVDVPVEALQLGSYSKNLSAVYDLYGVSNHSGTLHGGHYTAYCKHPYKPSGLWHLYNDRSVSNASRTSVISYEAYLLFFEKREEREEEEEEENVGIRLNGAAAAAGEVKGVANGEEEEGDDDDGDEEW